MHDDVKLNGPIVRFIGIVLKLSFAPNPKDVRTLLMSTFASEDRIAMPLAQKLHYPVASSNRTNGSAHARQRLQTIEK